MNDLKGKTAVITGGSMGIGEAFARRLAADGARLVLVARGAKKLEALAETLRAEHGVEVAVHADDLGKAGAGARVLAAVHALGWKADLLVNNAGFGGYGPFESQASATSRDMVDLNVNGLVELTAAFLPELLERKGGLINVSSVVAFQPVPYMAVYGATKAFVQSFTEALWAENRGKGLRVLAVCPGATETPFFDRMGSREPQVGPVATPESVVKAAMRAFHANRAYVVTGATNWATAQLPRLLPRQTVARAVERMMRPRAERALPRTA